MKYNEITFSEIDLILDNMEDEYVNKIPSKLREFIKGNKKNNYIPNIDSNKSLEEQKLQKETKILLSILYMNYWCESEEEKKKLLEKFAENENIKEAELKEKYNIENIYRRNISKSNETEQQENSLQIYKEDGIFKKIWNKIIRFFIK